MSTLQLDPPPAPAPAPPGAASPSISQQQLGRLRNRARTGIRIEAFGVLALLLIAYAVPTLLTDRSLRLEWGFRAALLLTFVVVVVRMLRARLWRPLATPLSDDEMALAVERRSPGIRQALISSLQFERVLRGERSAPESQQMMQAVVDDVRGRLDQIPFGLAIDAGRVRKHAAAIGLGAVFFAAWAGIDSSSLGIWAQRNLLLTNVEWPRYTKLRFLDVPEGGVRLPQGDALTLRIDVGGPVPDQVYLRYDFQGGERGVEPMSRTGEREFTLTLDAVLENAVLRAEGGDGLSDPLRVQVVERPRVEELAVTVVFPEYMQRDKEAVPPTESELRVPRGAQLLLTGRSHKPIEEAFLLFVNERKFALQRAADGFGFAGELRPEASGLLVVDVIDRDRLGAGAPPKLIVRLVDDRPPSIDFKLRGISNLITGRARLPGELKIKDDFGLREVAAAVRIAVDNAAETAPRPAASPDEQARPKLEQPFEPITVRFADGLRTNALRYETSATIDLKQWSPNAGDQMAEENRVRPGMLLSLRFSAKDNFGPGDPHEAFGEVLTFRVVTREKLLEELRRRQIEQREELARIREEERTALFEIREMMSPAAGNERATKARARLKALARQQQALGRRAAFVGESYQRILWEFENNELIEPAKVRELENLITVPLAAVAREPFPATARLIDDFAATGQEATRSAAIAGYDDILVRLDAIIAVMGQAETLAALLEELRGVIKIEDSAIQEVERRLQQAGENRFGKDRK